MAWRSSGMSNDEMIDNLCRFGVISSEVVEKGFRAVDRKLFVPKGNEDSAHTDQPLKEGNVHISAPHIYGASLEALELQPDSSLSFLNIGSGTGYLSCIVADILGPKSLNFGVEIHPEVVAHSHAAIKKWHDVRTRAARGTRGNKVPLDNQSGVGPHLEIVHGNGLLISPKSGESLVGFDRIYVGAAVDKSRLVDITKLLCPGGILVGPVDDELVKVVRIGPIKEETSTQDDQSSTSSGDDAEDSNLSGPNEFTTQVLSGVRFAPLLEYPVLPTVIPARVWNPDAHRYFPDSFRKASLELLLCSGAEYVQPLPRPAKPEDRVNIAAMIPKVLWMEVLSFTHRKWFTQEESETEYLKKRLLEEQANAAKAQRARLELEVRCQVAERERDVYRLLARRWQSRLHVVLQQQRQAAAGNGTGAVSAIEREISLGALLLNGAEAEEDLEEQLIEAAHDSSMEEDDDAHGVEEGESANAASQGQGMEEDEEDASDDEYEYFSTKEVVGASNNAISGKAGDDESVIMSDADDEIQENSESVAMGTHEHNVESLKARAVSISSDDL